MTFSVTLHVFVCTLISRSGTSQQQNKTKNKSNLKEYGHVQRLNRKLNYKHVKCVRVFDDCSKQTSQDQERQSEDEEMRLDSAAGTEVDTQGRYTAVNR